MSLRARLVLTLLLLAAVGLLVLGAVTYASQRDFQQDQLDDEVSQAERPLGDQLEYRNGSALPGFPSGQQPGDTGGPGPGPDFNRFNARRGVYGTLLTTAGKATGSAVGETEDPPVLPADPKVGRLYTVDSRSGELSYRVGIFRTRDSARLVAVALPRTEVTETLNRLLLVTGLVIAGVLVLLGAAAFLLVRAGLRPLERMGATAGAIAAGDLSQRVDDTSPRTEVGRLGIALNGMLGRLELAFAEREASEGRLRQFLSDASHELRTPLSSIRGYAELYRMGVARSGEDVEKAMGRIEDEAARMGVLVEDLLVLARLDEVRDAVPEPVDAGELAQDAVADARAQAPEREITAEVDDDVLVLGEPNQLRQVLANLVRNALVHTPVDAAIEVGARREGAAAVLTVRDHGPGLPAGQDPALLFDRFWRSEGGRGRERGKAGAGLGLAIVAGIVAAHGGSVEAADTDGGGALFTVRLPALAAAAGERSQERPSVRSRGFHAGGRS